ncbi:ATP-binding protein [Streptomyces fungicidicus]|uniref:Histidine kinase/HSP90-like ATPase domain-containing protein n=2 Tax=Streptomyces TaxID=1883 RepID=A0A494V0M9_9ACTN|nr:ATP-binding protein [Streptomyces fungicidicus]AYL38226.1 hypothetical protein CNQ36_24160 [Streptomyces fungicidicus]
MSLRTPALKSSSLHVPSDTSVVSSARRTVVAIVRGWDLPLAEDVVETLELLTGEVVANAVVHTGEGCRVTVSWDGTRVRLDAEDAAAGRLLQCSPADLDGESGRGLELVNALAHAWGCRPTADGKAVWFEIDARSPSTSGPTPESQVPSGSRTHVVTN